jgi:CBS domain-containing protein
LKTTAPPDVPLSRLLEYHEPLLPDDSAAVALARLRAADAPALPVLDGGRPVGLVGERELLTARAGSAPGETCRHWLRHGATIRVGTTRAEAAAMLQRPDIDVLVVVDEREHYLGLLTRRRLLLSDDEQSRPHAFGGMATPIGVHLTDGHHRGGSGDVALLATGAYVFALALIAQGAAAVTLALLSRDPQGVLLSALSEPLSRRDAVPDAGWLLTVLPMPFFLLALRLSPLAGYHGAEHQAVHCVERGLPLNAANAALMPRPHPRCGTNLLLIASLIGLLAAALTGSLSPWLAVPAVAGLYWRVRLGRWLQQHCTTRPASPRQLNAAVAAAQLLLTRYRKNPHYRAGGLRRLWNRGVPQVVAGAALAGWAWSGLTHYLAGLIIGL